jgi:hypothetical protein
VTLPTVICEAERNCSKLSTMKDKIHSAMLEGSLNYLSILPMESDVTKPLFIAEAIEEYPAEKLYEIKY